MNNSLTVFNKLESEVRSYCRSFPTVFTWAKGSKLEDINGNEYIDFFSGAGALNYGHNHPKMKNKLVEYIASDNIVHGLDMATQAKKDFLLKFREVILTPRKMNYKIMFPGPTGTNAVESALKLARKVTGRDTIISFTNAFHGMTLGALSVTGNKSKRQGSGSSIPAAIILETVQGEGGLNTASFDWLQQLETLCREKNIVLIVDDIQAGCGRTGSFFSFEAAGIKPDIICLSKSISGYGLPMAINLIKPELDIWSPGEHNGTFRGNNPAFVTATEALNFWKDKNFSRQIQYKAKTIADFLKDLLEEHPELQGELRGRGLMQGIACGIDCLAKQICSAAFEHGLIVETSGAKDEVIKLMPALTIDKTTLLEGLEIMKESIEDHKIQSFIAKSSKENKLDAKRLLTCSS